MNTQTDKTQLYTIREVARLSGLPESTLRYYETIGLIHPITRDASSKHRVYNEQDVNFVIAIACLNATGMSIEDMRTYLKNRSQGAQAADEQVELLETQKRLYWLLGSSVQKQALRDGERSSSPACKQRRVDVKSDVINSVLMLDQRHSHMMEKLLL